MKTDSPIIHQYVVSAPDSAIRIRVGTGSVPPRSLYMPSNIGTTNMSIADTIRTMMQPIAIGYAIADLILRFSSSCFSSVTDSRSSTSSSMPPVSPLRTIDR